MISRHSWALADARTSKTSERFGARVLADPLHLNRSAQLCCRVQADSLTKICSEPNVLSSMMRCPYRVHGIHHGLAHLLDGAVPSCDMHTHIRNSRPFYIWHHAMILYNYEIPVCARVQMTALLLMRNRHRRHDFLIMMGTITLFRRSSMSASISLSSCLPTSKVRSRISVFYLVRVGHCCAWQIRFLKFFWHC